VPSRELDGLCTLPIVGAGDHDASCVVVDLIHLEIKSVDDRQHDAGLQRGAICGKEPIQRAWEFVVVDLALGDEARIEQPLFLDRIERVAVDEDVL
jgi:hypothetical protein